MSRASVSARTAAGKHLVSVRPGSSRFVPVRPGSSRFVPVRPGVNRRSRRAAFATYALTTGAEAVQVGSKLGAREINPGPEAPGRSGCQTPHILDGHAVHCFRAQERLAGRRSGAGDQDRPGRGLVDLGGRLRKQRIGSVRQIGWQDLPLGVPILRVRSPGY